MAFCSGGIETTDGNYIIHTFLESGTLVCTSSVEVEYLVVAGGGAGGVSLGGGGGAGGYRTGNLLLEVGEKTVTIGAGGAKGVLGSTPPSNGGDSVFDTIISTGGGKGGSDYVSTGRNAPGTGGSGGGGIYRVYMEGAISSPVTSPVQGYKGGDSSLNSPYCGGGGGGAGALGSNGGASGGGGGAGRTSSISGSPVTYAVGGGGAGASSGPEYEGESNTGNGGSGSVGDAAIQYAGGSGIVIIRYLGATPKANHGLFTFHG